jgi:sucrose phosphorylase
MSQPSSPWKRLKANLAALYSAQEATWLVEQFQQLIHLQPPATEDKIQLPDVALISYADSLFERSGAHSPLQVLRQIYQALDLQEIFPVLHLLPFYPWDTDRGFSVKDYRAVAPENGTWEDVAALAKDLRLMFDFVANHASVENPLVQGALITRHLPPGDPRQSEMERYRDFVLAYAPDEAPRPEELAALSRPRAAPVLTPYQIWEGPGGTLRALLGTREPPPEAQGETGRIIGQGLVWTTFSRGTNSSGEEQTRQVDLNFSNPMVLLETVKILLFYVARGASMIRLDAVGYLWKRLGSSSLHEPETHQILVCLQSLMELAAPKVVTIAEVNEPQARVFSYLGSQAEPESDMIYQFTHFPLAVHAVFTGKASFYQDWLQTLGEVGGRQFITVLGSHDGLGMKPVRGILPEAEIQALLQMLVEERGGLPNFAVLPGGKSIVYEVCGTPWSLINGCGEGESRSLQLARYRAVIALGLLVRGLPAFYLGGALGLTNPLSKDTLDENRSVNRQRQEVSDLLPACQDSQALSGQILKLVRELLTKRAQLLAFDPKAPTPLPLEVESRSLVAVHLPAPTSSQDLLALVNVASLEQEVSLRPPAPLAKLSKLQDHLSQNSYQVQEGKLSIRLPAFGVIWLGA